jgi:type II secretory pathway predicted ATPase ExeA
MQNYAARIDPGLRRVKSGDHTPSTSDNPFNPGFGVRPPVFAGRQTLVNEILARLGRGPGRHEFITLVVGPRGVGKTVLLNEIGNHIRDQYRWLTIDWNADRRLLDAIAEQADPVRRQVRGFIRRTAGRVEAGEMSIKATPGGIGAEVRVPGRHDPSRPPSAYGLLHRLATAAAERRRTIVLLADELQAGNPDDLRELADAVQQLSNVAKLPLGMVGVGLPSTQNVLQSAKVSPGFTERLIPLHLDNLDFDATCDALELPILDAGRDVDAAAIEHLARASRGYPYAIQLAGHHCWERAGRAPTITIEHATRGAAEMYATLENRVFGGRWEQISPADRRYLIAAAQLAGEDDTVSTGDIAGALERNPESVSGNRGRLINQHHVLQPAGHGRVRFSIPGLANWVRRQAQPTTAHPDPTTAHSIIDEWAQRATHPSDPNRTGPDHP